MSWIRNVRKFLHACTVDSATDAPDWRIQAGNAKNLLALGIGLVQRLCPKWEKPIEPGFNEAALYGELAEIYSGMQNLLCDTRQDFESFDAEYCDDLVYRLRRVASGLELYKEHVSDIETVTDEDLHPGVNKASTWVNPNGLKGDNRP